MLAQPGGKSKPPSIAGSVALRNSSSQTAAAISEWHRRYGRLPEAGPGRHGVRSRSLTIAKNKFPHQKKAERAFKIYVKSAAARGAESVAAKGRRRRRFARLRGLDGRCRCRSTSHGPEIATPDRSQDRLASHIGANEVTPRSLLCVDPGPLHNGTPVWYRVIMSLGTPISRQSRPRGWGIV